ncbi:Uncharacterised protein [Vibrio cholerae]|nr:Uncharacterised protein [Vibrio cholerae]
MRTKADVNRLTFIASNIRYRSNIHIITNRRYIECELPCVFNGFTKQ